MTQNGWKYLNNALKSMNPKINNFNSSNKDLIWIVKRLICTSVFWDVDTNIACKYINFWLNKNVKDFDFYEYHSIFNNFKEFVNKFYTVVEGDFSSYKNCSNNIKILNSDEFKKIDMLYTLYNEYDELKKIHPDAYKELKTCDRIQTITKLANDVAHSYKKDDDFIKALRDLRDKIKNGEGKYKELCNSDLKKLDTMVTIEAFPDKVPDPPAHKDVSKPAGLLEETTPQALAQGVSENRIGNEPGPNVNLQERLRTLQLTSEDHLTQASRASSPPEGSHHERPRHAGDSHKDISEQLPFSREEYERSHDTHSRPVYSVYNPVEQRVTTEGVITSTEGAQSYLENIKGTITGVLGSVDPAPVLGVSGGMGVLFVLFKYTPVGSFFGGRRGRIRQIPSSFRGFPPGDFANFQEYDGGLIGYSPMSISSLAE